MGMYAEITFILLAWSPPDLLSRIGKVDSALPLSLTTILNNRSLFGSSELDVTERDPVSYTHLTLPTNREV